MKRSINIETKDQCCGCGACYQRCPKHCIQLSEDCEGFIYPNVNHDRCIDCGLCVDVCPVVNKAQEHQPLRVYAAKHGDDAVRMNSSSGGVFSAIAERTIANGGVVFGARFDENWEVEHAYTETIDGLAQFRGSKYVQSRIGNTFLQAEQILKQGREVLFSGTPCQIAGLKRFLRKDYPNLIAVDIICHGVPSPLVWRTYVSTVLQHQGFDNGQVVDLIAQQAPNIADIRFRNKLRGWDCFGFSVHYEPANVATKLNSQAVSTFYEPYTENIYMNGFLRNLYLRPSCACCSSKSGKSGADITLGDFWGIKKLYPELYDKDGVSLVIVASDRGEKIIDTLNMSKASVDYVMAVAENPPYVSSAHIPQTRKVFWQSFSKDGIFAVEKAIQAARPSIIHRILSRAKRLINL